MRTDDEDLPLLLPERSSEQQYDALDPDMQFGGHVARKELETRLLRKLDIRMSILIVVFILNYIDRNSAAYFSFLGTVSCSGAHPHSGQPGYEASKMT